MSYQITGHTRLGGLLGYPVDHSLSPAMHNVSFAHLGIDRVYLSLPATEETLAHTVQTLRSINAYGFNLTMPVKTAVIPLLDELSKEAELIGAVNTVVNEDGRLIGYNTDGIGFMRSVTENGIDVPGSEITILGAGGAASAIAVQAALDGAARLHILNRRGRSWNRALALADRISAGTLCMADVHDLEDMQALSSCLADSCLLINATSVGMAPGVDASPVPDPDLLRPDLAVGDVIYHPPVTRLLREAAQRDCRTFNGENMLLYQGAAAFRLWTGMDMPVELVRSRCFSQS